MKWFKRISFFVLTNILVMVTISIAFNLITAFFGISWTSQYYPTLMLFCAMWGMGGAFISLWISKWMAKRMYGVQILDPVNSDPRFRWIIDVVHRHAQMAGIKKMPEVGIYESPDINAFATGPSRDRSLVALSTGLLNQMSRDEIEGVIGHEVSHVANGDMVTMTLIQGIVNAFVMFFARILANVISSQVDEKMRGAVHFGLVILFDIVFAILGSIAVNYFSRLREYRADAGGAKLAGKYKMIAGLRRLQSQFERIEPDSGATATLKISNRSTGLLALFSTHPSLESRIQRLERLSI